MSTPAEGQGSPQLDEGNAAFCVLPFLHTYFSPDGHFYLCCVSPTPVTDRTGRAYNIQVDRLLDVFHSPDMNRIRQRMLAGEKVPHCETCYDRESRSPDSHRMLYNDLWLRGEFADLDLARRIHAAGARAVVERPLSADFRFGNLCNLQCQICNAHNSSKIEADPGHSAWNESPHHRLRHRFAWQGEWYEAPELVEEIHRDGADVRDIKLGGGEPSISKATMAWLKHLIDAGKAGDIRLSISTNTTNASPVFFDLIRSFKAINLFPSIDGFGALNEYLRYPSRWEVVERNARHLREMRRAHGRIEIQIAPVLTLYNVLTISELFDWSMQMGFGVLVNEVRGLDHIDLALLPPPGRQLALERIRAFQARWPDQRDNESIQHICSVLEQPFDEVAARRDIAQFWDFTHYLDERRGMAFQDYCPEAFALLSDYFGAAGSTRRAATTTPAAPAERLAFLRRAVAELERGNWQGALALLDVGGSDVPIPGLEQARATALAQLSRPREAADALLKELAHHPSFHAFRFFLAMAVTGGRQARDANPPASFAHHVLQALDQQAEKLEQAGDPEVSLLNAARFVSWVLADGGAFEQMWNRMQSSEARAHLTDLLAKRALASGRPLIVAAAAGAAADFSLGPSHREQDLVTLERLLSRLGIAYRPGLKRSRVAVPAAAAG